MQRILIEKPGGYDRLKLVSAPTPPPGPGEVLVASQAIGVNYADCIVRMGLYSSAKKYVGWPITPGFEFAGVVEAVGDAVSEHAVGDHVFGLTRFGAYASHVLVPEGQLFPLFPGFTMERAAVFPTTHLTAWYALCALTRPRPGQRVLVHSAAGGVGTAALRICEHLGCTTIGVVGSAHKVSAAREAGADFVIDRSSEDLWKAVERIAPRGADIVLESTGVATLSASYNHLAPAGYLVIFGLASMLPRDGKRINWPLLAWNWLRLPRFNPISMLDGNKSVCAFNLSYLFDQQDTLKQAMSTLREWAAAGALPAPPVSTYSLANAAAAHRDLESGKTIGKLVLIP